MTYNSIKIMDSTSGAPLLLTGNIQASLKEAWISEGLLKLSSQTFIDVKRLLNIRLIHRYLREVDKPGS